MTDPHKEALAPCPFCGCAPEVRTYETESLWSHATVTHTSVKCGECDVGFDTEPGYDLEAPAAWNRRAPDPLLEEAVGLLRRINRTYADMQDGLGNHPTELRAVTRFLSRMEADRKGGEG